MPFILAAIAIIVLIVISNLYDLTVLDKHDLVAVLDGGKTMRNDKGGTSLEKRLNTDLQKSLGLGVDGRRCLVKDENRRIFQDDAGDGEALLLAA